MGAPQAVQGLERMLGSFGSKKLLAAILLFYQLTKACQAL
jgi:hypothetical protein